MALLREGEGLLLLPLFPCFPSPAVSHTMFDTQALGICLSHTLPTLHMVRIDPAGVPPECLGDLPGLLTIVSTLVSHPPLPESASVACNF